jgi:hypothetical protein
MSQEYKCVKCARSRLSKGYQGLLGTSHGFMGYGFSPFQCLTSIEQMITGHRSQATGHSHW